METFRPEKINVNSWVIFVDGRISWDNYKELDKLMQSILTEGCRFLKLDLAALTTIHSCAFGPIIDAMATLEARGGSIGFRNVGPESRRVFAILDRMEIKQN